MNEKNTSSKNKKIHNINVPPKETKKKEEKRQGWWNQ